MKLKISELFYSAQGEGRFVGVPSVFLRTYGCNFTCSGFGCLPGEKSTEADEVAKNIHLYKDFLSLPLVNTGCDSYASWHPAFKELSPTKETSVLVDEMLALTPNNKWVQDNGNDVHLVITGGEPLLGWQRAYQELLSHERMQDLRNITFETNGTQTLQGKFIDYLLEWGDIAGNQVTFSVSPKLSASGEKWEEAIRPDVVKSYFTQIPFAADYSYFKFVVSTQQDVQDALKAKKEYEDAGIDIPVYLMPVGGVNSVYEMNERQVADFCRDNGLRFSPRIQVPLYKNAWGT